MAFNFLDSYRNRNGVPGLSASNYGLKLPDSVEQSGFNPAASVGKGALSGAGAGATAGSLLGPLGSVIGTGAGALFGAIGAGINASDQASNEKVAAADKENDRMEKLKEALAQLSLMQSQVTQNGAKGFEDFYTQASANGRLNNFRRSLASVLPRG